MPAATRKRSPTCRRAARDVGGQSVAGTAIETADPDRRRCLLPSLLDHLSALITSRRRVRWVNGWAIRPRPTEPRSPGCPKAYGRAHCGRTGRLQEGANPQDSGPWKPAQPQRHRENLSHRPAEQVAANRRAGRTARTTDELRSMPLIDHEREYRARLARGTGRVGGPPRSERIDAATRIRLTQRGRRWLAPAALRMFVRQVGSIVRQRRVSVQGFDRRSRDMTADRDGCSS